MELLVLWVLFVRHVRWIIKRSPILDEVRGDPDNSALRASTRSSAGLEHRSTKPGAAGSNPAGCASYNKLLYINNLMHFSLVKRIHKR